MERSLQKNWGINTFLNLRVHLMFLEDHNVLSDSSVARHGLLTVDVVRNQVPESDSVTGQRGQPQTRPTQYCSKVINRRIL